MARSAGGWIRKKDGRYQAGFSYNVAERDGKTRRKQRAKSFDRRTDAQAWLRAELSARHEGTWSEPSTLTVGQVLDDWLTTKTGLRSNTFDFYAEHVSRLKRLQVPAGHLAGVQVQKLRQRDVTAAREALRTARWSTAGTSAELSPTTVNSCVAVLRQALRWAQSQGLVARNVAEGVKPLKAARFRPEIWSPEQTAEFLAATAGDRLGGVWRLAIVSGMRRGEIAGLRWGDFDLDGEIPAVSIVRAATLVRRATADVSRQRSEVAVGQPKTEESQRVLELDPVTVTALRSWRAQIARERLAAGPRYVEGDWLVVHADGRHMRPDALARRFTTAVRRAGLPVVRFHDLRHACASFLLASGSALPEVCAQLGHSRPTVTLGVYSHALKRATGQNAARLSALLDGTAGG